MVTTCLRRLLTQINFLSVKCRQKLPNARLPDLICNESLRWRVLTWTNMGKSISWHQENRLSRYAKMVVILRYYLVLDRVGARASGHRCRSNPNCC